jgi:neutral amino acid transport system permease protein
MEGYVVSLIIFTAIFSVFGLGLNLQWGFTGLINFGHVAFMTLGAYTTALLSSLDLPWLPTPLQIIGSVIAGALLAASLGFLIGCSTLRLRTDYLAIVTIGVSEIIRLIALNEEWLTRGPFGVQRYPLPLGEFNPTLGTRIGMIVILLGVVGIAYWQLWRWMQAQIKQAERSQVMASLLPVFAYVISLVLLIVGIGLGSRSLKSAATLPNWLLGLLLLAAIAGLIMGYLWLARRFIATLPEHTTALALVAVIAVSLIGAWVTSIAVMALYDYASNPTKNGLMWISVLMVAVLYGALQALVRSPWGRVLKAVREDEEVARALGKNVFWYKLQAFMIGGLIAGIAGSLYAWQLTVVYPDNFLPLVTFNAWTIVVLGGAGNNLGTLLGAAIFWAYQSSTRFVLSDIVPLDDARLGAFRIMVIGLLLMVLMVWRPQGILGKKEELTLGR